MTLKKRVTEYFDDEDLKGINSNEVNPDEEECESCGFKTTDKDEFEDHKQSHKDISDEFWNNNYNNFVNYQLANLKKKTGTESVDLLMGKISAQEGKKIKGTLAYAGVSLNNRLYLPEQLAKGDGQTLPLIVNHASTSGAEGELHRLPDTFREGLVNGKEMKVGTVKLNWDAEALTLYYSGEVDDEFFQNEIGEADMAVSLGMYYDANSPQVCDKECYTVIKGGEFSEVSLVYHAGFPIATIEANEAVLRKKGMEALKFSRTEDPLPCSKKSEEAVGPHSPEYDQVINDPNENPTTSGRGVGNIQPETRVAQRRMDENEIGVTSSDDLEKSKEEVSGPPASTTPTVIREKNTYKESLNTNNKIMSDEIDKNKLTADSKAENTETEEEEIKSKDAESQASGTYSDGGGAQCDDQNKIWDAETEQCVDVNGSVQKEVPSGVKTNVSDGGKSGENRRVRPTSYRRSSVPNADIASEKRRVKEYYKKLDRLEALRGMKVSEARIKAKEQYLKEKRLDGLIRGAKESVRPKAIVARKTAKAGESFGKVKADEKEVTGPARWYQAIKNEENVPNSFIWHVNKQGIFENSDQRFIKSYDANENTQYAPLTKDQKRSATEAVTGPAGNDFMRIMSEQVLVLPNGKVVTPIRQFCETKVLPTGTKEAFFYDFGAVGFSDITEDGSTVVGESAVVVRSAGGPAGARGTKLILGYTQIEESPIDLIASANRSFALESVNDESKEVVNVSFNTDSGSAGDATNRKAVGGGSKANRWVSHSGSQITADASGLGNLTFAGLVSAKGVIEDEGLDPSNLVTYTTGKAIRDLVFDPDLDSFISFSRPAIITEATVERIAGTNVVRSSALASGSQSGSSRSVMFVPNIAFGLISGRDLTMEAQRRNELQSIFLTGTQRIAGFTKNVEATCRISHL